MRKAVTTIKDNLCNLAKNSIPNVPHHGYSTQIAANLKGQAVKDLSNDGSGKHADLTHSNKHQGVSEHLLTTSQGLSYISPSVANDPNSVNDMFTSNMINSRCYNTLKTAYHCLQVITNNAVLDTISPDNHDSFNKKIGLLALDHSLGTPQHKKAILGHMLNYPMNVQTMYGLSKYTDKITTNEPIGPSSHVITELPTCEALLNRYSADIKNIHVTSDTTSMVMEGQKQTNYDYVVKIIGKLDKALGLKQQHQSPITIDRLQDCKDGGGIFKHSTRGSMGIITFDKQGKNIQTTPVQITANDLKLHNEKRLFSLKTYLMQNNLLTNHFKQTLDLCNKELNSDKSIFDINLVIENILCNNVQRHPLFPRSISFVFLQKVDFENTTNTTFQERLMHSLKPNRNHLHPYSLDKKGDAKEFYISLLKTYDKEVDPQILKKLWHLKHSGIKFNNFFNDILNSCISNL